MNKFSHKTYRSLQVDYTSGVYAALAFVSGFLLFSNIQIFYFFLCLFFLIVLTYLNKPFIYIFNSKPVLWFCLIFLYFITISGPYIIQNIGTDPIFKFTAVMVPPVGSVLISLFLWKFYNEDVLEKAGWKNISGRWG